MESKEKSVRLVPNKSSVKKVKTVNKSAQKNNKVESNKLELLVTIVNRNKAEFYQDLIQSFEVNMQMIVFGKGTANKEILEVLGLANSEKAIIFSIIKEEKLKDALYSLDEKFRTIKNGKGIAYTIPLSSVIGVAIYAFLSNNKDALKEEN
jgi:hypothetical protein